MRISKEDLQSLVNSKMSQREIAQKTGIPEPTIAWTMKRYGITPAFKPRQKESKETLQRMYWDEGLSVNEISKRLQRSDKSIWIWMREYGIDSRPRGTNQSGTPFTTEEFASRIAENGHTLIGEYSGWDQKVRYKCRCGREADSLPSVLLRGGGCKACASEKSGKSKRIHESDITDAMNKNGDTYYGSYRESGYLRVQYKCALCGNDADVIWGNYRKGQKCGGCKTERFTGENNHNWNPDLTEEERQELGRKDSGYSKWVRRVKKRDGFRCQCCGGEKPGHLVSHHLDSYNLNEHLRTDVDNGVTLCDDCHKEFHAAYGYGNNTRQQFLRFLQER